MSFSLRTEPKIDKIWIASINLYLEEDDLVLYYNGKIHRCLMKYIIDDMYQDCEGIDPSQFMIFDSLGNESSPSLIKPDSIEQKTTRI